MMFKIFVSLGLTLLVLETVFANMAAKQKLIDALQEKSGYGAVEPDNVTVSFGLGIICANYDPATQILKTKGWERYTWTDPRLTWDPTKYDGVTVVRYSVWSMWRPDIMLYNSNEAEDRGWVRALVYNDGSVIWIPPTSYTTYCAPSSGSDGSVAQCSLKFGLWTYDGNLVGLEEYEGVGADVDQYDSACPYSVTNLQTTKNVVTYPCCAEPYPDITVTFSVVPGSQQ